MVQINLQHRELTMKVVYYGPALSGKTTNLTALHALAPKPNVGRLMSLDTRDDRTLFFDMLPVTFETEAGFRIKIKLLTVPGQVIHRSTRQVILQGADAIAFIADSQLSETEANKQAFRDLAENLAAGGLPVDIPMVVQFNKRDLPNIRTDAELGRFAQERAVEVVPAIAIRGVGVRETFEVLLSTGFAYLEHNFGAATKLGIQSDNFSKAFFANWSTADDIWGDQT